MITIIEGPSGSGKSYQIYERMIAQSIEYPEKKFFLIVPEQFTMQAQKDIVMQHPRHGTMNIDIVSFNRLAYRVFEELNIRCDQVLEDFGKSMLLQKILMEHRKELPFFGPSMNKVGFIDELKSLMTELFQYRITEEMLESFQMTQASESMLYAKLHDLIFVYKSFQKEVADQYIIAEHILEMLAAHVPESDYLAGSELFFDGYTGFTPIQYSLLEALAGVAANMTFTVTIDQKSAQKEALAEHELFYLSKDTIQRICRLGERLDVYVEEEFLTGDLNRFENALEIAHLEKNIFRYPYTAWEHSCSQIHIQQMKNTREELRSVARQIHALVREGKYRYRDIAIIHGDVASLQANVEEIFPQLDIPYFMDVNQSLYMNPCLESIRALLDIAEQDYSFESVFRFFKTGVTGFAIDHIEQLENYCRKSGIRGEAWWRKAFDSEKLERYPEGHELHEVMHIGNQVFNYLTPYSSALKKAKCVSDYVAVFKLYLDENQMKEKLAEAEVRFEQEGNYVQAKAYKQIYEKLQDIFEKMDSILGNAPMTVDEFHILLDVGLNDIALGVIPPSLDQLTIGDIERTRLNHIQVLFVLGVNDGIIPKAAGGAGILSEVDRKELAKNIELAPNSRQQAFTEQFYLYQNITKPSRELYLTYHMQGDDGSDALPAYLIARLKKLFPHLEEEYPFNTNISWNAIETAKDSKELLVSKIHADNLGLDEQERELWAALYEYYSQDFSGLIKKIEEGIQYTNVGQYISPETASRLYGDFLNTSVSKLETYSSCPYQFFLEYGLKLRKRELNEVSRLDMGNFFHKIVERIFRAVEAGDVQKEDVDPKTLDHPWEAISDDTLRDMVSKEVDRLMMEDENTIYNQSYANIHLLMRMKELVTYAVIDLRHQLITGKMIPYQFELSFNRKNADENCKNLKTVQMKLENGSTMQLNGVIDRIDICQDEENIYVKILDYKSSRKEIDMTNVSAGLQLQLLLYTKVVMEVLQRRFPDKNIIPAGSLYYHFKMPMVPKSAKEETTQRNIAKVTAMTGFVNEDDPCRAYMGSSELLPSKMKQESGEEDSFSTDKYLALLEDAQETIQMLGENMVHGEIPIRPIKTGRNTACTYCDYKDVCKIDLKDGGNQIMNPEQLIKVRNKEERAKQK